MLGSNPGLLLLWHWQLDTLTTGLHLIHKVIGWEKGIAREEGSVLCANISKSAREEGKEEDGREDQSGWGLEEKY
jgi:hypothetical protein